jgi:peptidoglycan/xylan/chitin deacetylase (PgdA/CDA1 family)
MLHSDDMKIVTAGGALAAAGWAAWAVRGRSSTVFAPSVWRGVATRRSIALTFDDGPSESTAELLDLLDRYSARATFFQCGFHADRLPSAAREVSAAGHEIGNHTYSHRRLWLQLPSFVRTEVERAQRSLEEVHGISPKYFRPPYGVRWFGLRTVQQQCGLIGVMWTHLGRDWKLDSRAIVRRLVRAARPGAIFCLHDGREAAERPDIRSTIQATSELLPALLSRGFRFETISQILCPTL